MGLRCAMLAVSQAQLAWGPYSGGSGNEALTMHSRQKTLPAWLASCWCSAARAGRNLWMCWPPDLVRNWSEQCTQPCPSRRVVLGRSPHGARSVTAAFRSLPSRCHSGHTHMQADMMQTSCCAAVLTALTMLSRLAAAHQCRAQPCMFTCLPGPVQRHGICITECYTCTAQTNCAFELASHAAARCASSPACTPACCDQAVYGHAADEWPAWR